MPSQTRNSSRLRSSAAKKIQKRFRGKQTRKQVTKLKASRKIQTRVRGKQTRKVINREKNTMSTVHDCSICFEPLIEDVRIALPCGHRFHKDCIRQSLTSTRGRCPNCRTVVTNIPYVQEGRANRTFGNVPLSQQQPQAQAQAQALDLEQLIERGRWQLEILERSIALQRQQLPDAPEIPSINFNLALDNEIRAYEIEGAVFDFSRRLYNEVYRSLNINDETLEQDVSNIIIRTAELLRRARNNRNNAERIAEHLNNPEFRR